MILVNLLPISFSAMLQLTKFRCARSGSSYISMKDVVVIQWSYRIFDNALLGRSGLLLLSTFEYVLSECLRFKI